MDHSPSRIPVSSASCTPARLRCGNRPRNDRSTAASGVCPASPTSRRNRYCSSVMCRTIMSRLIPPRSESRPPSARHGRAGTWPCSANHANRPLIADASTSHVAPLTGSSWTRNRSARCSSRSVSVADARSAPRRPRKSSNRNAMYAYLRIVFGLRPASARCRNHEDNGSTGRIARSSRTGIPSSTSRRSNSARTSAESMPGTPSQARAPRRSVKNSSMRPP